MLADNVCACGRTLTSEEQTYFGTHCTSCETAMSDALNDDKDPKILIEVLSDTLEPIIGFDVRAMNKPLIFKFIDGSKETAVLVNARAHCAYDEDGKPRNLMINLDFK